MREFIQIVESTLHEDIVGDDEGLAVKGWYDLKTRKWVRIPAGWHHSGYVWNHPDEFRWNTVFRYSPEEYVAQYDRAGQIPPKFDDTIIDGMASAGWVRLGLIVRARGAYAYGPSFKGSQQAFRYYTRHVLPVEEIRYVILSMVGSDDTVRGDPSEVLRQRIV